MTKAFEMFRQKIQLRARLVCLAVTAFSTMAFNVGAKAREEEKSAEAAKEPDLSTVDRHEWLAYVEEQTRNAKSAILNVRRMLKKARAANEPLKISCLVDKLTQMESTLIVIEERTNSLTISLNSKNDQAARQHLKMLNIQFDIIQDLRVEAESCIGEADVVLGETETTVTIDGNMPMEDPSQNAIETTVDLELPRHASGYF